jgi:cell division protein FtsB
MHGDVGIWDKLTKIVILLIVVAFAVALGLWYLPLIHQNERMRKEILKLETEIKQEEEFCRQLRATIDALSKDPKAVERLARERLGYAKPGETIVRFENTATNAPPKPAPAGR